MSEDRRHDTPGDEQLSEAYRELSTEQTSARLDKAILDMAQAGSPKKSLSRLLAIKPLAWAATVVLTVSLVFLQQQEVADTMIFEDDVAREMLEPAAAVPAEDESSSAASDMSSFAPAAGTRAKMQEVEAMMIEQDSADSSLPETVERGVAVELQGMQRSPQPRFCDEAETADASSWYQCVLRLEEEGKLEEAASERTRLFSNYPDFQVR